MGLGSFSHTGIKKKKEGDEELEPSCLVSSGFSWDQGMFSN